MKEVVETLQKRGYLFRRLEPFALNLVGSRKRLEVFHGVDLQSRYTLIFKVARRSRILRKETAEWMELKRKIEHYYGYPILRTVVLVEAPICSKAVASLEAEGWRVLLK